MKIKFNHALTYPNFFPTAPDPEYGFEKKMELKKHGQTKKKVKMRCKIDDPNAKVKWYKDGVEIKPSDPR